MMRAAVADTLGVGAALATLPITEGSGAALGGGATGGGAATTAGSLAEAAPARGLPWVR